MRHSLPAIISTTLLSAATVGASAATIDAGDTYDSFKFGGRIMLDATWSDDGDDTAGGDNAIFFRRARLFASGKMHENIIWKSQIDFADIDDIALKDVYLGVDMDFGKIMVGHFDRAPTGLENEGSSKYMMFIERPIAAQAYDKEGIAGIRYTNTSIADKKATLDIMLGSEAENTGGSGGGKTGTYDHEFDIWARGTYAIDLGEDQQLQVGLSLASEHADEAGAGEGRPYRPLGGNKAGSKVNAGEDGLTKFGVEGVYMMQSLTVQAEVLNISGDDQDALGFYLQGSYFLTGEKRGLKKGTLKRVSPKNNLGDGGYGAVELKARVDSITVDDGDEYMGFVIGANWYLNKHTRMMLDYISGSEENDSGYELDYNAVSARFQIDF